KFARSFENYLMEGSAPSEALRSIFQRFRAWLVSIYRAIRGQLPPVNPQLREVFDRMLATQEQIEKNSALREYEVKSAEELGLAPEEYAEYSRSVEAARNAAQVELQKQYMGEARRWFKGWIEPVFNALKAEIREQLKAR